jgi:acyl carrier protein
MTRDEIAGVIKKRALEIVPGLNEATIDFSRSLRDQGASSLDVVELVSVTMRELKVKIPRDELAKIATLDGLVDLFFRIASGKPAAVAS